MSDNGWHRPPGADDGSAGVEYQLLDGGGMRLRAAAEPEDTLTFTAAQIEKFRLGVEAGEFDLPAEEQ
jgi:hypothetical protein